MTGFHSTENAADSSIMEPYTPKNKFLKFIFFGVAHAPAVLVLILFKFILKKLL